MSMKMKKKMESSMMDVVVATKPDNCGWEKGLEVLWKRRVGEVDREGLWYGWKKDY